MESTCREVQLQQKKAAKPLFEKLGLSWHDCRKIGWINRNKKKLVIYLLLNNVIVILY